MAAYSVLRVDEFAIYVDLRSDIEVLLKQDLIGGCIRGMIVCERLTKDGN